MVLTREVDNIINKANLTVRDTGGYGYILGAKGDKNSLFINTPLRILALYSAAALLGADVEYSVLEAANINAWSIEKAKPDEVFAAVNGILLTDYPHSLAPLINAGGLISFGIKANCACLHPLADVPALPVARWWAFLHLTGADLNEVSKKLCLPKELVDGVDIYNKFWRTAPPKDMLSLKLALAHLPEFDFDEGDAGFAASAFAALDSKWQGVSGLYAELDASGEPFRIKQLAITAPEILQLGVPQRRIDRIMAQLLTSVCKAPAVNTYPALAALAKTLSRSSNIWI